MADSTQIIDVLEHIGTRGETEYGAYTLAGALEMLVLVEIPSHHHEVQQKVRQTLERVDLGEKDGCVVKAFNHIEEERRRCHPHIFRAD